MNYAPKEEEKTTDEDDDDIYPSTSNKDNIDNKPNE